MPSPNVRGLLVGDFAEDAAGDLNELGHVVAQIFRLLIGELKELLEQLHEERRAHNQFGLMLDAIGIEAARAAICGIWPLPWVDACRWELRSNGTVSPEKS